MMINPAYRARMLSAPIYNAPHAEGTSLRLQWTNLNDEDCDGVFRVVMRRVRAFDDTALGGSSVSARGYRRRGRRSRSR